MQNRPSLSLTSVKELDTLDYEDTSFGSENNSISEERSGSLDAEEVIQHHHDDIDSNKILFRNIAGLIEVVSVVPTYTPRWVNEQIKIYHSGATIRIYFYDYVENAWHYAALT